MCENWRSIPSQHKHFLAVIFSCVRSSSCQPVIYTSSQQQISISETCISIGRNWTICLCRALEMCNLYLLVWKARDKFVSPSSTPIKQCKLTVCWMGGSSWIINCSWSLRSHRKMHLKVCYPSYFSAFAMLFIHLQTLVSFDSLAQLDSYKWPHDWDRRAYEVLCFLGSILQSSWSVCKILPSTFYSWAALTHTRSALDKSSEAGICAGRLLFENVSDGIDNEEVKGRMSELFGPVSHVADHAPVPRCKEVYFTDVRNAQNAHHTLHPYPQNPSISTINEVSIPPSLITFVGKGSSVLSFNSKRAFKWVQIRKVAVWARLLSSRSEVIRCWMRLFMLWAKNLNPKAYHFPANGAFRWIMLL